MFATEASRHSKEASRFSIDEVGGFAPLHRGDFAEGHGFKACGRAFGVVALWGCFRWSSMEGCRVNEIVFFDLRGRKTVFERSGAVQKHRAGYTNLFRRISPDWVLIN